MTSGISRGRASENITEEAEVDRHSPLPTTRKQTARAEILDRQHVSPSKDLGTRGIANEKTFDQLEQQLTGLLHTFIDTAKDQGEKTAEALKKAYVTDDSTRESQRQNFSQIQLGLQKAQNLQSNTKTKAVDTKDKTLKALENIKTNVNHEQKTLEDELEVKQKEVLSNHY